MFSGLYEIVVRNDFHQLGGSDVRFSYLNGEHLAPLVSVETAVPKASHPSVLPTTPKTLTLQKVLWKAVLSETFQDTRIRRRCLEAVNMESNFPKRYHASNVSEHHENCQTICIGIYVKSL